MAETPEDRIAAALRTIGFEVAVIKATATERVEKAEAKLLRALELLRRYRSETPLGHQPQMIALQVDEFLTSGGRDA